MDSSNYIVKSESIVVTLKSDFVSTLKAGKHTIGIVSDGGIVETTFTIQAKSYVDTADRIDLMMWSGIMLMSIGLIAVLGVFRKHAAGKSL